MSNHNLFWAALAVASAKRYDRDLILPGNFDARFNITGNVNGEPIKEKLVGTLTCNDDQSRTTSSKPSLERLLSAVLYQNSPKKRREICSELIQHGLSSDEVSEEQAKELIRQLTTHSVGHVRGSLAFATS